MKTRPFPLGLTPFDLPLLVFLATAGVGVWAAYDRSAAWAKFWMIVAAVVVYYALALQPEKNLWPLAGACALVAAGIAGYFLLTYDWQTWPADFGWLTQLGVKWMGVRLTLPGYIDPNVAGGVLAILLPFVAALEGWAWRQRRKVLLFINTLLMGLALLGLLFTSSRAAWAALAVALALWGAWSLISRLSRRRGWSGEAILVALIVIGVFSATAFVAMYPGGIVALVNQEPGVPDGSSRWEIMQGAWRLAGDFPYTGGGLNTFSGLYSTYILVIFVPMSTYSHNLFLDVAVEQGWFGLVALAAVLAGSVGLVVQDARRGTSVEHKDLLRGAVLASLVVMCLHGLLDDALYGNGATPLIFLTTGMAVAVTQSRFPAFGAIKTRRGPSSWRLWAASAAGGLVLLVAFSIFQRSLLSSWYANLGAVQLARLELAGWPDTRRDTQHPDLRAVGNLFEKAVSLDPRNRTANQRLGQLALARRDFDQAVVYLEAAYKADDGHRGVRKDLGFTNVWLGRFDRAAALLGPIPEASYELGVYSWWWGTQGRVELADRAVRMAKALAP